MAILALKKKIEPLLKTATGYIKLLLSSEYVVMNSGADLQSSFTALSNKIAACGLSKESVLIASNARGELDVTFTTLLTTTPKYVIATPYVSVNNVSGDIAVSNITTTGFHVSIKNLSATGAYFKVSYIAGF